MLVLSRKVNQSLVIDGDIIITVLSDRAGRVRLGIEAPDSVPIHRREVFNALQTQKQREDGSDVA